MNYLFYNPKACNNTCETIMRAKLEEIESRFGKIEVVSVLDINPQEFLPKIKQEDKLILFGGDGTLNNFVNNVPSHIACRCYLYKAGTGNDFLTDVTHDKNEKIVELNKYIEKLPTIYVNDIKCKYLNGIGFGLDGEACRIADEKRAKGITKINYASISIGLMLFKYKCPDATVTVDGVTKTYKKVWLASGMNGRYYGGGMMIAPNQNRLGDKLTEVVIYGGKRFRTLMMFPNIFKGGHTAKKYSDMVEFLEGNDITVEFSIPVALQIDGETVLNVKKYRIVK